MSLGPFDLYGGPFLQLYAFLLILTIIVSFVIPALLRPEGGYGVVPNVEELAYLTGGPGRFVDALVTRLLTRQALVMVNKKQFQLLARSDELTPAERGLATLSTPIDWSAIQGALLPAAGLVDRRLVDAGLLMDRTTNLRLRFWQTLPFILLIGFGAIKWQVGVMRDRPVEYLTGLLILTAILALIRFAALDRRMRSGRVAVDKARVTNSRLGRAPMRGESDMAVALFGTAALAGSSYSSFHQLRSAGDGSSSGSGGDNGGGGGGCGGGGCGGCGGS